MEKLTIRLERWGRTLVYQVLEQDESLRNNCNFVSSKGFSISSKYYPSMERNAIYIRGIKNRDDEEVFAFMFETIEEAEKYKQLAQEAVAELNVKL